jgi:hypothetical protein
MSDLLLEWMSFRGNGRLDELPAELTSGPPRRVLDDLSMLGHVETLTGPPGALLRLSLLDCPRIMNRSKSPYCVVPALQGCSRASWRHAASPARK